MPGGDGLDRTVTVRLHRDSNGFITRVDDAVEQVLGWTPDQLVGSPSTEYIHPNDQPSAVAAWMEMISDPERTYAWRGRYRHADGGWVWVEMRNTNLLEVEGRETVLTEMSTVDATGLSIEEQLRAREEMLSQLSDALPVGLVHFDADHQVISTNDRLRAVLGHRADGRCRHPVLRRGRRRPGCVHAGARRLAASVGWAYEEERTSADELISRADQAMYEAKRVRQAASPRAEA